MTTSLDPTEDEEMHARAWALADPKTRTLPGVVTASYRNRDNRPIAAVKFAKFSVFCATPEVLPKGTRVRVQVPDPETFDPFLQSFWYLAPTETNG